MTIVHNRTSCVLTKDTIMGKLIYGTHQRELEIEDRLLAHLKIVILTKLRRTECFAFSWENDASDGSGLGTIWLSPHIPLEFDFYGRRPPRINRAWLQALTSTAERGELHAVPEMEDSDPTANHAQTRF